MVNANLCAKSSIFASRLWYLLLFLYPFSPKRFVDEFGIGHVHILTACKFNEILQLHSLVITLQTRIHVYLLPLHY